MSVRSRNRQALADPDAKRDLNRRLFGMLAPRYGITTRALSFGRDGSWKDDLVSRLSPERPTVCLDIATGTGDIARRLARRYPGARIVALDLTREMLDEARRIDSSSRIEFVQGDIGNMPLEDGLADVLTGGYALRNVPDLGAALREIRRVLKPGGVAAFLEFARPASRIRFAIHLGLLHFWGGICGLILHGRLWVYRYIPDSLARFPDPVSLEREAAAAGLEISARRNRFLGLVEICEMKKHTGG